MGGDRDAEKELDRQLIIDQARTVAAMDIWIRNGGRPPDVEPEHRERGRTGLVAGETAMDALLDELVGFRADGTPVGRPAERGRGGRERGGEPKRTPEHSVASTVYEWTFYPEHDSRKDSDSSAYRAARKKLVATGSCLVCGVDLATLHDAVARKDEAKNPFNAVQLETHHRVIEWALGEAIDVKRFNERFVARRRALEPTNAKYATDFDRQQMLDWIDHDPDNLWVLCDVHHRAPFMGIHAITRPHWDPQDLVFPKFWNRPPPPEQDPRPKKPPKPQPATP